MNPTLAAQEIARRLSPKWSPAGPDDLIGSTRQNACIIRNAVAAASTEGLPLRFMLLGRPGLGKTTLSRFLMGLLQCDRWHTTILNGTQMKIETIEDIARSLQFKELFGTYRLIGIEEVDKVPHVAQVRLLTLLDELPAFTAVCCTSNCKLSELEERFQTRFMVLQVDPPTADEIDRLLSQWPLPEAMRKQIATFACGNVRQALLDAQTALLAMPVQTAP